MRMRLFVTSLVFSACLLLIGCQAPGSELLPGYSGGMVASVDSLATVAGLSLLERGGNAIDVATGVAYALAVTHPQAGNIGGGGFALLYVADSNRVYALDFRETAPAAATRDMYLDESGDVIHGRSTEGFSASGTPGTVAGLVTMHDTYGSLSRDEVMQPAIDLAMNGFAVDSSLSTLIADYADQLIHYPASAKYFLPGNRAPLPGDTLRQADLAIVLQHIAQAGHAGFYSGAVATRLVDDVKRHGGLIAMSDLAEYEAIWREPIKLEFAQLTVYSMSPPSSGGIVMGEIIGMLANFPIAGRDPGDPWYIHLFVEACRLAYSDRSAYLGDPDLWYNPDKLLLSPEYLYDRALQIDTAHATPSIRVKPGLEGWESENTTHFCVVDSMGNVVSLTYTLNSSFGCGRAVEGLGFLMNNEMDDFSVKPGVANQFGLIGGDANAIEPRKRMLSSMSPTIVFHQGRPMMAVGSPGGSKIITAVTSTILNYFGFGMSLDSAVNVPHYHHQWLPDLIYYETGAFSPSQIEALEAMGHNLRERSDWGDLQAIVIQPNGTFIGVSDHRGDGWAGGF